MASIDIKAEKHGDHADYLCVPCGNMRMHGESELKEHNKKYHKM